MLDRKFEPNVDASFTQMTTQVRKAVIPAAGRGTRLRPLTRALPKEMLPVGRRPMIEYSVAEAALSGITQLCIVLAPEKDELVRDHFRSAGSPEVEIDYVVQPSPLGLMDAVRCAADFVEGDPFALLLPDNIIVGPPALAQLVELWATTGDDVIGLVQLSADELGLLGRRTPLMLSALESAGDYRVTAVGREKRQLTSSPGKPCVANIGRYVLGPDVFSLIESVEGWSGTGELDDGPVLAERARTGRLLGRLIEGEYYDAGNPAGYRHANRRFGIEVGPDLERY